MCCETSPAEPHCPPALEEGSVMLGPRASLNILSDDDGGSFTGS